MSIVRSNMKSPRLFTPILFLVFVIAGGCIGQSYQPSSQAQVTGHPPGIYAAITPENLQFLDFQFTSIDPTDSRLIKAITRDQAVRSALEFEPLGKNATSISTQVGYFDNISTVDLQNHRPVWLVTYHGVDTVSSGPPEAEHLVANTLTVAIDAFQGVGIVSMTLAVITPESGTSQTTGPSSTETGVPSLQEPTSTASFPVATSSSQTTATQGAVISDPAIVIKNCEEIFMAFEQKLKTTGWIRTVYTIVYFDNTQKAYRDPRVMEQWYRLDPDDQLVEGYTWFSTLDGTVEQETLFQGGIWYNVTVGGSSRSYNTKVDFSGSFADQLKTGERVTQEAVRYHDANTWRFFYELNDGGLRMARAMFFDRDSGLIAGNETYAVQSDGSLQLVSGAIYSHFDINADPPLERFQQILEKAQRMP
jgi:hypothetical protein